MLQLKNTTPFAPAIAVFPNEHGIDTLYVMIKASFKLTPTLTLAEQQVPPTQADVYWGEPGLSSLKYASEMHLSKPGTDVVLVGQAWAPSNRHVPALDVRLAVADKQKLVRVFGDRRWRNGASTAPEPFQSMPLVYERAYGGIHVPDPRSDKILAEERNPIGVGFAGKRKPEEFNGLPLPNLEDPRALLQRPGDLGIPAGFGFIAASWLPRRQYVGTYDAAWQKGRAPYLPEDFDARFFHAAHPDLTFNRYLSGGEPVQLDYLSPHGPLHFILPRCEFSVRVRIAGRIESPPLNLETVLIEPDENRLCLSWRAALPCDKQTLKVEEVIIEQANSAGVAA